MSMMVIGVNGFPRSGKTTFVDECVKVPCSALLYHVSTITPAKRALRTLGWSGLESDKTKDVRNALCQLKELSNKLFNGEEGYLRKCVNELVHCMNYSNIHHCILFVDAREPAALEMIRRKFSGKTLLVRRIGGEDTSVMNPADQDVLNHEYDFYIDNAGDLRELARKAVAFVQERLDEMEAEKCK